MLNVASCREMVNGKGHGARIAGTFPFTISICHHAGLFFSGLLV
jgi:hypothetical protein